MIKNKSKDELIELVYSLTVDNTKLEMLTKAQHDLLDNIYGEVTVKDGWFNRIVGWFKLKKTLITLLNKHEDYYFNSLLEENIINMNKNEIIEALEYINAMHKNTISIDTYRDYVGKTTDLDVCKGCGKSKRILHNKHQRLVSHSIKNNHPEMAVPVTFISNKYGSDFYHNSLPLNSYDDLSILTTKMLYDIKYGKSRGGQEEQVDLMERDLETLKEYIDTRINYKYVDTTEVVEVEVSEPSSGSEVQVEVVKDIYEIEISKVDSVNTLVNVDKEVDPIDKVDPIEPLVWNLEDALNMKENGQTNKTIGLHYKVSGATVGRRFKAAL